jgi:hypothetical protein
MKMKTKNKVTRKSFVEWIMGQADDYESMMFQIKDEVINELVGYGKITITIEDFFNRTGYIPQRICVNSNGDEEYTTEEVELVNEKHIQFDIISNYIDWFTSNEDERERLKKNAELYVDEDHAIYF